MQHALKSKVLAAALSVMIAITFMPTFLWQTADKAYASFNAQGTKPFEIYSGTSYVEGYDTLQEAFTNVSTGQTIKMIKDVTISSGSVKFNQDIAITLDFGEHSYTVPEGITEDPIEFQKGTITLKGTSGTSVKNVYNQSEATSPKAIAVTGVADVTMESGNFQSVNGSAITVYGTNASFTMNGGYLRASERGLFVVGGATATISKGTMEGTAALVAQNEGTNVTVGSLTSQATDVLLSGGVRAKAYANVTLNNCVVEKNGLSAETNSLITVANKAEAYITGSTTGTGKSAGADQTLVLNSGFYDSKTADDFAGDDRGVVDVTDQDKINYILLNTYTNLVYKVGESTTPRIDYSLRATGSNIFYEGFGESKYVGTVTAKRFTDGPVYTCVVCSDAQGTAPVGTGVGITTTIPVETGVGITATITNNNLIVTTSNSTDIGTYYIRIDAEGETFATETASAIAKIQVVENDGKYLVGFDLGGHSYGHYVQDKEGNPILDTKGNEITDGIPAVQVQSGYTLSFATNDTDGNEIDGMVIQNPVGYTDEATGNYYKFDYWTANDEDAHVDPNDYKIIRPTTFYAHWTQANYKIKFDLNGQKIEDEDVFEDTVYIRKGETVIKPTDPDATKEGVNFKYWSDSENGDRYDFDYVPTANMTLYAIWDISESADDTHNVAFDLDGGSYEDNGDPKTSIETQKIKNGNFATEPDVELTKNGYKFTGWFDEDGKFNFGSTAVTGDITLKAGWEKMWSVAFFLNEENNAQAITTIYVEDGDKLFSKDFKINNETISYKDLGSYKAYIEEISKVMEDVRDGYKFNGFYEAGADEPFNFNQEITDDVLLYGKWTPITYTVNFDMKGHGEIPSQTVKWGETIEDIDEPQDVTGYKFEGWKEVSIGEETLEAATKASGGSIYVTTEQINNAVIKKDVTFESVWTAEQYDLVFNENCEGGQRTAYKVEYNSRVTAPTVPARDGYTFAGWTLDKDGDEPFDFNTDKITDNTTLYAQWSEKSYNVVFDMNGHGKEVGNVVVGYNTLLGSVKTIDKPEEAGWTFEGWLKKGTDTAVNPNEEIITGDVTYVAQWTIAKCHVNLNYNGGTPEEDVADVNYGEAFNQPEKPTRKGFSFVYWCTDSALTTEYNWATKATGNIELYAKWEADPVVTIYWEKDNDGTVVDRIYVKKGERINNFQIEYKDINIEADAAYINEIYTKLSEIRTGYTFTGFVDKDGKSFDFGQAINGDTAIYGTWEKKTCKVVFDMGAEGYGGSVPGQEVDYGEHATKPADPTETGHVFKGWLGADGNEFDFATAKITEDTVIYAKWAKESDSEDNIYIVEFDANGGKINKSGIGVEYDIAVVNGDNGKTYVENPGNPDRTGYDFVGWFTEETGGDKWVFNTDEVTGDMNLYAHWEIQKFEVTFDPGDGHSSNDGAENVPDNLVKENGTAIPYNTRIGKEPSPQIKHTGYKFLGWYYKNENGQEVKFNFTTTKITKDYELYAKWTEKYCTLYFYDNTSEHEDYVAKLLVQEGTKVDNLYSVEDLKAEQKKSLNAQLYDNGYTCNPDNTIMAKAGYHFGGWYKDKAGKNSWNWRTEVVTDDMDLYGVWEPLEYEIEYYGGNIDAATADGTYKEAKGYHQTLTYDTNATLEANKYELKGYKFSRWALIKCKDNKATGTELDAILDGYDGYKFTKASTDYRDVVAYFNDEECINTQKSSKDFNVVNANEFEAYLSGELREYIFVAEWVPIKYSVQYDKNADDATGTMEGDALTYNANEPGEGVVAGASYETKANDFTRKGYHFIGWNTKADGTGMWIYGEAVKAEYSEADGNHTAGTEVHHPCEGIVDGNESLGVKKDGSNNTTYVNNNLTDKDGDTVTLYAQWKACENYLYTETVYTEVAAGTLGAVKLNDNGWYLGTSIVKRGTTGEVVKATVEEVRMLEGVKTGFEVDTVNSTKDLTIVLEPENYVDFCGNQEGNVADYGPAPADIKIVEQTESKFWGEEYTDSTGSTGSTGSTESTGGGLAAGEVDASSGTAPTAIDGLVYNGTSQKLVNPGKSDNGTVMYYLTDVEGAKHFEAEKVEWTDKVPEATDASKEYVVFYYIKGNGTTHQDSDVGRVGGKTGTITIAQKTIGLDWGKLSFNYDGKQHVPTATATGLVEGDACDVTVVNPQTEIGEGYLAEAVELSNPNYVLPTNKSDIERYFDIVSSVLLAKGTSTTKSTKVTMKWTSVTGADKYVIYGTYCGLTSEYNVKAKTGAGYLSKVINKLGGKKLKAGKVYKFYVEAYRDGKLIAKSNTCHVISKNKKGNYTNPKGITANESIVYVNEGEVVGVAGTYTMGKGKLHLKTNHCQKFRYVSSDKGIATVDSLGTVTGVHTGVCTVYIQAVNGIWCAVKVIVQ